MNCRQAAKWILQNTIVSSDSLTPQLRLHLITENCPLWMSTPDKCPLNDPYWAFYWPGGQSITKYIADHPRIFKNSFVLDVGCGCGSASIVSAKCGATVIANDIDRNALIATKLNFRLNKVDDARVIYSDNNLLLPESNNFLLKQIEKEGKPVHVILGDMFYNSDFALTIFKWLERLTKQTKVRIFIGDPDRHPLTEEEYSKRYRELFTKRQIVEYSLPGYVIKEHYGFNVAKVHEIFMNK